MRIRINSNSGIYGADGVEMQGGAELELDEVPAGWAGRYETLSERREGKAAVTNPAGSGPNGPFSVKDDGNGWHGVYDADGEKVKSLRKDDAEAFASLSADEQLAFVKEG